MPPVRRVVAALLSPAALGGAGMVAVLAVLGPAAPAAAATTPCVGVVVDGRLAGGSLVTACAPGDPDSGFEALTRAGVSYAFVPRQPGLVCQLGGVPACSDTGTETYWSYWWRAKGSSRWVYASTGAGSHDPDPGDTEAWVWQDGGRRQPPDISFARICPQAAPTRKASPTAASPAEAVPVPDATRTPKPPATSGSTRAGTSASTPVPTPTATASTAGSSPASTASPTASVPSATAAAPGSGGTADDDPTSGPPWAGIAVGTALVAGLGGAAVVRTRRRPS